MKTINLTQVFKKYTPFFCLLSVWSDHKDKFSSYQNALCLSCTRFCYCWFTRFSAQVFIYLLSVTLLISHIPNLKCWFPKIIVIHFFIILVQLSMASWHSDGYQITNEDYHGERIPHSNGEGVSSSSINDLIMLK